MPPSEALDLGCGRGEWLEVLREINVEARGVDLDSAMVQECDKRGLNVERGDVLSILKSASDSSKSLLTAFHLVEHLEFEQLQHLFREAIRVLRPGGLLILETPNPENLIVGTLSFYLDPTHRRPIPPQLLTFLAEHTGFPLSKIIRLNSPIKTDELGELTLLSVLMGVSPDYALIAQKGGGDDLSVIARALWEAEYGLSLGALAEKYESQLEEKYKKPISHLMNSIMRRFRSQH